MTTLSIPTHRDTVDDKHTAYGGGILVVGLAGYSQAGKSEAAKALRHAQHDTTSPILPDAVFKICSFASPLKIAATALGLGAETPHHAMRRDLLQTMGARCRKHDLDWFIKVMSASLDSIAMKCVTDEQDYIVLIDDVRYPNEVKMIRDRGGFTVMIDANGANRVDLANDPRYGHESESMAGLDRPTLHDLGIHTFIDSNRPLDVFREAVVRIVGSMIRKNI